MSSDFNTSIKIKGTRGECLAFLRVMNTCVFDQGSPKRSEDDWDTIYDPVQHKYLKGGR